MGSHNRGVRALLVVAAILYLTCIKVAFDKNRGPVAKLALIGGRTTLTSFGLFLHFMMLKMGASMYTCLVSGFGFMIAAIYLPWIAADLLDGKAVKQGHAKPPDA